MQVALTEECKDQKIKRDEEEEESKIEEKHSEISPNASKVSGSPKPDYIHVRARRGQATDSHSLAERVSGKNSMFFPLLFSALLPKHGLNLANMDCDD